MFKRRSDDKAQTSRTRQDLGTTNDGIEIYYKDWGSGQPIVFSHGWPLSADDWDAQMLFFIHRGYRVVGIPRQPPVRLV